MMTDMDEKALLSAYADMSNNVSSPNANPILRALENDVSEKTGKAVTISSYTSYRPDDFVQFKRIFVNGSEVGEVSLDKLTSDNLVSLVREGKYGN
jgi:hypothetical protein